MWKLVLILCLTTGFDYTPPELLASAPALPAGYDAAQAMSLDLPGVLALAVKQHLGITLEREQVKSADLAARSAAWALYEPTLGAGYTHTRDADAWSAGVGMTLPTGGHIAVQGSTTRGPANSSALSFSLTQPLLRGLSLDLTIPRMTILTARIASENERQQLAITAAGVVRETEAAYWDVVYSLYSYNVTVKSRQLAHDTVELVKRQIAAGMVAASDLTGAENTLAFRELSVIKAAHGVEQSWDTLRTVLNLPRSEWKRPILPTDRPAFVPHAAPTVEDAFATAKKHRGEFVQADLSRESAELAVRKAKNDALPQLDIGLTTSLSDPVPVGTSPAGWSVVGTLSWTPLGRASKVATQQARIRQRAVEIGREQQTQSIYNEVRSAVRDQEAAALEVVAASQSRKLALESLSIETKKYIAGESSNLNLAQLQGGLADAELSELSALIAHEKAEVAVLLATGQLLDARHISLAVVR